MKANAGIRRTTRVAAADSLDRNLEAEDAEAKRYGEQFEDGDGPGGSPEKEDPMRILAGGDVTVHQNIPQEQPQAVPQTSTKKPASSTLAKVALGGALLASGVGLGVGIPWAMGAFDTPAPVSAGYEYLGRVVEPKGDE